MRPRPASRKRQVTVVPADDLAEEIAPLMAKRRAPVAIVTGLREWQMVKRQPEARPHLRGWPGDGDTFCGVAVIVRPNFGPPQVVLTMAELEDILLGDGT